MTTVAALRSRIDVFVAGDPEGEIDVARAAAGRANAGRDQHRACAEGATARRVASVSRVEALQRLLVDARLLDPPDHAALARAAEAELAAALAARTEVARTRPDAAVLADLVEVLRSVPPSPAEVEVFRAEAVRLAARRDHLFHGLEALVFVREHREALAWEDASARLDHDRRLVPALEAAEADARRALLLAESQADVADAEWNGAVGAAQDARGEAGVARTRRDAARTELQEIGVGEPTATDVAQAKTAARLAARTCGEVEAENDDAVRVHTTLLLDRDGKRADTASKAQRLSDQELETRPHEERWGRLESRAREHGELRTALTRRFVELFTGSGSPNLSTQARFAGRLLVDRLRVAQRADDVRAAVESWVVSDEDRSGEGYLDVWLQVLNWVRRRLPAHIAEVDDPLEALGRLREELVGLEDRLRGQEAQLRGASEDVASHIEVQIRKAGIQVGRLNKHLEGVRFGAIDGIRVRLKALDHMIRVLRALRDPSTQELLFDPGLPLEDALDLLFQRYGGAGGNGQRLLDYREYIQLHAEVKRRVSTDWEPASATKLSTGEAIGVGAAVMMVVLAEWERDANLLRGRRAHGSLRFLFLDEANRLDRDNLNELFELCRTLELQLLIAAPEVAQAEGTTTYRLVRTVTDGREEVLVSGRRTRSA